MASSADCDPAEPASCLRTGAPQSNLNPGAPHLIPIMLLPRNVSSTRSSTTYYPFNTTHRCTIRRRKRAWPYARDPSSPDRHRCPRHNHNNRNAAGRITGLILQHRHPAPDPLRLLQPQASLIYIRCDQSVKNLHRFRRRGCAARQGFSHG